MSDLFGRKKAMKTLAVMMIVFFATPAFAATKITITNNSTIVNTTKAVASTGGNYAGSGGAVIIGATSTSVRVTNRR